ncbi:MAG: hypothetical protein EAZ08_13720 [Cytophagales bacterium]|nr:MAG: hypothetical protein EAZ08_13720 [Cytophagales bacterium]
MENLTSANKFDSFDYRKKSFLFPFIKGMGIALVLDVFYLIFNYFSFGEIIFFPVFVPPLVVLFFSIPMYWSLQREKYYLSSFSADANGIMLNYFYEDTPHHSHIAWQDFDFELYTNKTYKYLEIWDKNKAVLKIGNFVFDHKRKFEDLEICFKKFLENRINQYDIFGQSFGTK